jgi:hypothetical protein
MPGPRQLDDTMRAYYLDLYRLHGAGGKCPIYRKRCADGAFAAAVLIEAGVMLGDQPNSQEQR